MWRYFSFTPFFVGPIYSHGPELAAPEKKKKIGRDRRNNNKSVSWFSSIPEFGLDAGGNLTLVFYWPPHDGDFLKIILSCCGCGFGSCYFHVNVFVKVSYWVLHVSSRRSNFLRVRFSSGIEFLDTGGYRINLCFF